MSYDVQTSLTQLDLQTPANIYNRARNNVEWQPIGGCQQTANMSIDVKRGNAMRIAALTATTLLWSYQ